jgi:signal transduction histidine kinase
MARPGANTTGVSILASELDVKRLELLHEFVPKARRIGVLVDPTTVSTQPQLENAHARHRDGHVSGAKPQRDCSGARRDAGRMELEVAAFHLPQAIENALVLVRERALRRGITLDRSIDPELGEIQGDERKVKQVLLNLLSNAIKFTLDGGRINVQGVLRDATVEVSVSDTGVGIAPEDREAIFEEFRPVGTTAKKVEGTGLGLTLSRKFIELHGGRIWVESQVGVGSTFTFTLPVRRGE